MKRLSIAIMLAPVLTVITIIFVGGLFMGISQSFGYLPMIGETNLTFSAYIKMFSDEGFVHSLLLTIFVSFTATFLTIVLAIITALVLRKRFAGKKALSFIYQFPLTIPHLVIAIGILMLIQPSGLIARLVYHMGLISDQSQFPVLVSDDYGVGVILVYVWKQIPFIGLIVLAVLQSVGNNYEELSRSLGANKWQAFRYVLLPLIIPGILPASIICFAYAFGSYEVPYLLGKTFPTMLSVLSYRFYVDVDLNARPEAMAISIFIAVFVTVLVVFYQKLTKKITGRS